MPFLLLFVSAGQALHGKLIILSACTYQFSLSHAVMFAHSQTLPILQLPANNRHCLRFGASRIVASQLSQRLKLLTISWCVDGQTITPLRRLIASKPKQKYLGLKPAPPPPPTAMHCRCMCTDESVEYQSRDFTGRISPGENGVL